MGPWVPFCAKHWFACPWEVREPLFRFYRAPPASKEDDWENPLQDSWVGAVMTALVELGVKIRILLLDIDGVLNSHGHWARRSPELRAIEEASVIRGGTDPACMAHLNEIVSRTSCLVVLSSTIRRFETLEDLQSHFNQYGFVGTLLDRTPYINESRCRGREIDMWLKAHPEVASFAILDDEGDMDPHLDKWVKTSMHKEGLERGHIERVCTLLGVPAVPVK